MGIIPKEGEKKEAIGLIPLVIVHYVLALGIAYIGQRTKNRIEFFAGMGLLVFLIGYVAVYLLSEGFSAERPEFTLPYFLLTLGSWIYIAGRMLWIKMKKETEIRLF